MCQTRKTISITLHLISISRGIPVAVFSKFDEIRLYFCEELALNIKIIYFYLSIF
jgi:hypothetical protein